jgi:ADP-ribose pyrophosphatase YjhB (NUDIX family)
MILQVDPIPNEFLGVGEKKWQINALVVDSQTSKVLPLEATVVQFRAKSDYGTLNFGMWPADGHKGWRWEEQGGGGVVTVLYSWKRDEHLSVPERLFIGLRNEKRVNMGGDERRWCIPGGFIKPDETRYQAQSREAKDELGVETLEARELPGLPLNANRNYFIANPDEGQGIHVFALRIPFEDLVLCTSEEPACYELTTHLPGFKEQEQVRFFHWRLASILTADMIAAGAMNRLLADELAVY